MIPKHPFFERKEMDIQLAPTPKYTKFECEEHVVQHYMTAIPFPFFGKTMTHPNIKKRVAFHGCLECSLQEQYHEKQFLESFNQGDADETIISCGANIYKRETRQWFNDMEAEKIHAREFHEQIDEGERAWRVHWQAPMFNLSDPNIWTKLRMHSF
ncbi:41dfa7e3-8766-4f27-b406-65ee61427480 [Sclerotinia trifoliorum]|uniref:41dfa7e3-8766-4f27-b406-65ee61427480 n=1 Tax=Sclerotinia trifoliorum TaxID=28548 RepID=A0A8H2VLL9_9HELO|nr:41dfa7e3-8766-4f27-b406-65ee61427480 [Sclerotinia trifoliorum]